MPDQQIDFLAIGDTVVDAFIKLVDAHVTCKIDNTACEISMPFAAKIPYEGVTIVPAVGNSANAAVAASRLGLKAGLVTFLGDDINGRETKFALQEEHVNVDNVIMQQGKTTNYHYVLWFGDERTILIKHEEFKTYLPHISKPKWIYLSSLGEHAREMHIEIVKYLEHNPDVKLAFQPGTFQIKLGKDFLRDIYKRTDFFCCNVEEAQKILENSSRDLPTLLEAIQNLGPKIVCITDGKKGSFMRHTDQNYYMPIYPDEKPPYERTGAGDAFTSTFATALVLGKSPEEAITWGPINSMKVVQYVGAQKGLITREAIEHYLENAPESYFLIKI